MSASTRRTSLLSLFVTICFLSTMTADAQWSGWRPVPGNGTTATGPGAARFGVGWLFATGVNDSKIYAQRFLMGPNGDQFEGSWGAHPSGGMTDVNVAAVDSNQTLFVFSKGINDQAIYVNTFGGNPARWTGWHAIGGTTDAPLAATTDGSSTYLFSKGIGDKRVYLNRLGTDQKWSGWSPVPDKTTSTGVSATYVSELQGVYVFATDAVDGLLYYNNRPITTQTWAGWQPVPGTVRTDVPVTTFSYGKRIYVVAKAANNHIYYNVLNVGVVVGGNRWSGWTEIGGTTDTPLSSVVTQNGMVYLFSKGVGDKAIYVNTMQLGSS